jgi:hypothetical protein
MSALDECEEETIRAFENEGWQVSDKPFLIRITGSNLLADVSFIKHEGSERRQIIIVEIKCFSDYQRDLTEFYKALGQYQTYRTALRLEQIPAELYLTIPRAAFERFQQKPTFVETLREAQIKYVVVDIDRERIETWIT